MVARNLLVELSELASQVHEKKDNFAWDEPRKSFRYFDRAMRTVRFEYLVSVTSLADREDVLMACDIFQRVTLAVELVRMDMDHHEDKTVRTSVLWRQVGDNIVGIINIINISIIIVINIIRWKTLSAGSSRISVLCQMAMETS